MEALLCFSEPVCCAEQTEPAEPPGPPAPSLIQEITKYSTCYLVCKTDPVHFAIRFLYSDLNG